MSTWRRHTPEGRRISILRLLLSIALLPLCFGVHAQESSKFPSKPVRLIVPFTIGGSADIYCRVIGQKLSEVWNQQVVVDNRAGGNGIIGTDAAAKSTPDGYTLLLGTGGNMAVNPALHKKLPYKPGDLTPVTLISTSQFVLLVAQSVPAYSVDELLALARAKPNQLNYVSTGNGSPGHLSAALLVAMTGIKIVHVPYRSHSTMLTDIAAGRAHIWFDGMAPSQTQLRGGKVRALAVTGPQRARVLPNVPTIAESGVPGYSVVGWYGLFAPTGTPEAIMNTIGSDVDRVVRLNDVQQRFTSDGADPISQDSKTFPAFAKAEMDKWAKLIKMTGITAE